jgi:hypothetical protein
LRKNIKRCGKVESPALKNEEGDGSASPVSLLPEPSPVSFELKNTNQYRKIIKSGEAAFLIAVSPDFFPAQRLSVFHFLKKDLSRFDHGTQRQALCPFLQWDTESNLYSIRMENAV